MGHIGSSEPWVETGTKKIPRQLILEAYLGLGNRYSFGLAKVSMCIGRVCVFLAVTQQPQP